ncbi:Brain-specific angiogenesis inhibitor 1-associated protein 2 [Ameca splendens]|uniref:Brain-specific angiogenesis inhibitor 1-associated protein 2 n=1 Tax=Ameca splendens TaxID=208324 RepID=A0ABV0XSL4_9TELE
MPPGALLPGISEPISGAKPLPVPPELAAFRAGGGMGQQRLMDGAMPVMNGAAGGEDYQQWMESKVAQGKASPQPQRHGAEVYSNTLPVRKAAPTKSKTPLLETRTLPRSSSMAAGLERNGRTRVQAVFSHAAGDNSTLLSFAEGDVITLLVPEARDGWHYGENEKTRMRGWFPFSYTRLISESSGDTMKQLRVHNLHHGKSSSTGNLLEREDMTLPVPDYGTHSRMSAQTTATLHRQQRPYSVAVPGFPQVQNIHTQTHNHELSNHTDPGKYLGPSISGWQVKSTHRTETMLCSVSLHPCGNGLHLSGLRGQGTAVTQLRWRKL